MDKDNATDDDSLTEKPLDKLIVEAGEVSVDLAREIGLTIIQEGLLLPDDWQRLSLTEEEKSWFVSLVRLVNRLRKRCDLSNLTISPERLHIVTDADFKRLFGESDGFEIMGHAYIPERIRSDDRSFVCVLSHEIAHLTSYISAEVKLSGSKDAASISEVRQLRVGLQRNDADRVEFIGLNEAVTEYLAFLLRREAALDQGEPGVKCADIGDRIIAYIDLTSLLVQLNRRLAADTRCIHWESPSAVWRDLLIDYWTGRDFFLETLAVVDPLLYADLRLLKTDKRKIADVMATHGFEIRDQ
jgi:hypothetical protein